MVKVKKKVSRCFVGAGTLFLLFLMVAVIYLSASRNYGQNDLDSNSPDVRVFDRVVIEKQHSEVMKRAAILSQKYNNVTGLIPSLKSKSLKEVSNHKLGILSAEKQSPGMNIAIGMAQDTDPKNLVTFCSSLRKHSSSADSEVVLFINTPVPERSRDIANRYNILLIEFTTSAFSLSSNESFLTDYHPSSLRWKMIHNFFENINTRNRYSKVLLIDVRDSFFQSNPFQIIPNETRSVIYVFKGVESVSIGGCGWNGGWVKDCFGDKILAEIGTKNIICSGVSIGTIDVVYQYLTLMNDILMGRKESSLSAGSRFPGCERNGVDQGVHNVVVHKNMIEHLEIKSESDGKVVNMQGRTAIVSQKTVTNSKGILFPIVHQYDRYPDLQKLIFAEVLLLNCEIID
jgi:hypothetical protein